MGKKSYKIKYVIFILLLLVSYFLGTEVLIYTVAAMFPLVLSDVISFIMYYIKYGFSFFRLIFINKPLRLSVAYLVKIEVDNKYFLIKGKRGYFEPVGGVYRYFKPSEHTLTELGVENDGTSEFEDMRITLPSKNVIKFLDFFKNNMYYEYGINRKLNEELLDTNIFSKEIFRNIDYYYNGTFFTKIKRTTHYRNIADYEMLIYRIFTLDLSDKQISFLKQLMNKESKEYYFASIDELRSDGVSGGNDTSFIGSHTKYLVDGKRYVL